jgi:hypothetical protein
LIHAPKLSGSGSGKGLLARAAAIIAYGIRRPSRAIVPHRYWWR